MKLARILCQTRSEPVTVIAQGDKWVEAVPAKTGGWEPTEIPVHPVTWLPPVPAPVVFAIGVNYRAHAEEMNQPFPSHPVVTMKNPAAVTAHLSPVMLPRFLASDQVDYEVELAVVIGKRCKNILPENALDYVAGYTVANDISARDWQKIYSGGQWVKGKSFDTFCPLGPVLVTPDEIPDPDNLPMGMDLNGERMQASNTADMIFSVRELIAFLAGSTTLLPGTVILTGTPPGVGAARKPPVYLKTGDRLLTWIDGIGVLENPVLEEPLT
ncbi:MAG: fumarylacetoacetate hydrolase family protein [Kiritimatiellae bacterium]|nr:fumarylacetoacetate hydrolase family protein [Kiritimatiellia bacterium]